MKIYNALTNTKEEFQTQEYKKVKMYVCGPTVYNYIHVGNARPIVIFDAIRRFLEYKGYTVDHLQNLTDVDDRIIKRANEENVPAIEIANQYITELETDIQGLQTLPYTHTPRVTEEMESIIHMIQDLLEKGYAYQTDDGSVFFDTAKDKEYGKLSNRNIEELESGFRIEIDESKKSPMDFVLWKPAKPNEPKWASPWSEGRPGWHIECSAMSKKYLGDTIDIHAGGLDLIFPHHENEIAQSEAVNGKPMANFWMHTALINIDNQKMSKSKGNFFTLREIAEQYSYELVRFMLLSVHYRSPMNFSMHTIQAYENGFNRIKTCLQNLSFLQTTADKSPCTQEEQIILHESNRFATDFDAAMEDDFNTADAISAIFELVTFINTHTNENSSAEFITQLQEKITFLCDLLGLVFVASQTHDTELTEKVNTLVEQRTQARKNKDFKQADAIRNELLALGVVLEDTPNGVKVTYKG